ncbi:MAG: hypothetical protein R6W78_04860 [Bacteroidales bacterium]
MKFSLFPLLLVSITTFGQAPSDTLNLFGFQELVFHSDFERASLNCYNSGGNCDYFFIAMATDPNITKAEAEKHKAGFFHFLDGLKADRRFSRNQKTQVKHIFNSIHDQYFKLYHENPLFSEIFTNGNFNCLTASALFAMAFDHYGIPYEIILLPEHVYLLAYPSESSIVVETTNPLRGARFTIDSREKAKAVQSLLDLKIVSQEEVNQKGVDRVFNETYLSKETPDLKRMMGALYYNLAALETEKLRFKLGYELYKKSSVIFSRRVTTALLINHSTLFVAQNDFENPETYRVLAEMEKFINYGIPRNALVEQSIIFINSLQNAGKLNLADSAFVWLMNGFTDEEIKNELNFANHYNKALIFLKSYRYDDALSSIETAYLLKPEDIDTSFMLMELIMQKIRSTRTVAEGYEIMKSMSDRIEPLNQNKQFMGFFQFVYLELVNHYVMNRSFDLAEEFRAEFEERFQPGSIESAETIQYLEQVYSRASIIYYRERRRTLARNLLNSGLEYVPDSFELQSKLNALR